MCAALELGPFPQREKEKKPEEKRTQGRMRGETQGDLLGLENVAGTISGWRFCNLIRAQANSPKEETNTFTVPK